MILSKKHRTESLLYGALIIFHYVSLFIYILQLLRTHKCNQYVPVYW